MRMIDRKNTIENLEQNIRWIEEIECHQFPGWGNVTMVMRDAAELLKEQEAPTVGGWISVKDRTPEDETVVIAYVQHKIGWYRMFAWHDMHGWHSSAPEFDEKESDYVTHWMPMPEPPMEEEEGMT